MSVANAIIVVLTLGALVAAWRAARHAPRHRIAWVATQFALAAALAYVLLAPAAPAGSTLVVVTEGAGGADATGDVVALPGAVAAQSAERVPDLATALRRHPGTRSLVVVGDGLPARDRDAARGWPMRFDAAPPRDGLVALRAPASVALGREWRVRGHARGAVGGLVELLGPGDVVLASAKLASDGRFALATQPKVAGKLDASVRLVDGNGAERERSPVPVFVVPGTSLRLAFIAGAPTPELKYLRRWARDAGHALRTRIALSPGIGVRDAPLALDAATLAELDLVIVDERGFAALGPAERVALDAAVRDGLGLLLRATGPVPPAVAEAWSGYGWTVTGSGNALPVQLPDVPPTTTGPRRFERADVVFAADDAATLLAGGSHVPLSRWRAHGRGRVGTWTLLDAWKLALGDEAMRHGELWSRAAETLARARGETQPRIARNARVGERTTICAVGPDANVAAPDGSTQALLITGDDPCAAYWPTVAGWHEVVDGEHRTPFAVVAVDTAPAMEARERRVATRALAAAAPTPDAIPSSRDRTPLLAWLLVALCALAWWRERRG